jgi:hypothetical protein
VVFGNVIHVVAGTAIGITAEEVLEVLFAEADEVDSTVRVIDDRAAVVELDTGGGL